MWLHSTLRHCRLLLKTLLNRPASEPVIRRLPILPPLGPPRPLLNRPAPARLARSDHGDFQPFLSLSLHCPAVTSTRSLFSQTAQSQTSLLFRWCLCSNSRIFKEIPHHYYPPSFIDPSITIQSLFSISTPLLG